MNGEGLIIDMGGEPFEITRYNTHLYTFLGNLATRNHVFITTAEDEAVAEGVHIWQAFHSDAYDRMHAHIQEHSYTQFLNLPEVSEADEQAYERAIKRQVASIGDFIPEDFE